LPSWRATLTQKIFFTAPEKKMGGHPTLLLIVIAASRSAGKLLKQLQ